MPIDAALKKEISRQSQFMARKLFERCGDAIEDILTLYFMGEFEAAGTPIPKRGNAMSSLTSDKQERFVLAYLDLGDVPGRLLKATRRAGYGTKSSSNNSLNVTASRLLNDARIQAAIAEESRRRRLLAIRAGSSERMAPLIDLSKTMKALINKLETGAKQ